MNRHKLHSYIVGILAIVVSSLQVNASGNELEIAMRRGIRDAKSLFSAWNIRGKYYCESLDELESIISVRNGSSFIETTVNSKSSLEIVKALNDDYAFTLSKSKGSEEYSLTLVARRDDPEYKDRIDTALRGIYYTVLPTHFFRGWFIWDLIEHPDFKVKAIDLETNENSRIVKCSFSFTPKVVPANHPKRHIFGYIKFNASENWAIVEFEVSDSEDGEVGLHSEISFDSIVGQLPVTSLVTSIPFGPKHTGKKSTTKVKLLSLDQSPVAQSEFYLSHYGIEEPNFDRIWLGPWFWYLIAGIGCVATGRLILRRRQSRV